MPTHTIEVTDAVESALKIVASKDGITVDKLLQQQLYYYTSTVIKDYIEMPVILTKEQKNELDTLLATTKADYLLTI